MELHRDRIFGRYTFLEFKVCDFEFRTDWNADETDPLRRSADSYGFFHRDKRRFFEVDGVEWRYTEALHLIGFRGSEFLVCGFEF